MFVAVKRGINNAKLFAVVNFIDTFKVTYIPTYKVSHSVLNFSLRTYMINFIDTYKGTYIDTYKVSHSPLNFSLRTSKVPTWITS